METSPPEAVEPLDAVRAAIAEGRLADAEAICGEYLKLHPADPNALLLISIVAMKTSRGPLAEPILRKLIEANPRFVEALVWLAKQLRETSRYTQNMELLSRALEAEPDSVLALNALAVCYIEQWENADALDALMRALAVDPDYAPALDNYGVVLHHEGRDEEAMAAFRHAIEVAPNEASAYANLSWLLTCRGEIVEATAIVERALERFWNSTTKLVDFAEMCWMCGYSSPAERALVRAIELEPEMVRTRRNLARVLVEQGEFDRAYAELRESVEVDPSAAFMYQELAYSQKFSEEDRPLMDRMLTLLRAPRYSNAEKQLLHYALGKANDDLGDYGKAMQHFDEANGIGRIQFARRPFDRADHTKSVNDAIRTFTPEFFKKHRSLGNESSRPIFIVGIMRSGTTLTDQIVTSHPQVSGAGELTYLANRENYVFDAGGEPDPEKVRSLAVGFLNRLRVAAPNSPRVTDKLPGNSLIAGLILLLFPNARIIHCRRNTLDTCLSIYVTPSVANYGQSFSDIAYYHREYSRLMEYWRRVLPPDRFFELDYEQLVADRKPVVRDLMAFLDLPWDDAVMRHNENKRSVSTPSAWQAKQPIYTTSVERWRRYEPWIGDLLKEFPEFSEQYGRAHAG